MDDEDVELEFSLSLNHTDTPPIIKELLPEDGAGGIKVYRRMNRKRLVAPDDLIMAQAQLELSLSGIPIKYGKKTLAPRDIFVTAEAIIMRGTSNSTDLTSYRLGKH